MWHNADLCVAAQTRGERQIARAEGREIVREGMAQT